MVTTNSAPRRRGRPPVEGPVRSERVNVRLTPAGTEALDWMRADSSRSKFVRDLIQAEYVRRTRRSR